MMEPTIEDVVVDQKNPIIYQDEMQKIEVANESPILKKRKWLHVDKVTCQELVAEAQLMVGVASRCEIERSINENNVDESNEQKH